MLKWIGILPPENPFIPVCRWIIKVSTSNNWLHLFNIELDGLVYVSMISFDNIHPSNLYCIYTNMYIHRITSTKFIDILMHRI